jgi:hydrogenase maturation protein HypF
MNADEKQIISDNDRRAFSLRIKGIVQGVGFRPFIFTLAHRLSIAGSVINDSEGVLIEAEGPRGALDDFVHAIRNEAPPHSRITEIMLTAHEPHGCSGFAIGESEKGTSMSIIISPDLAPCPQCLAELNDPQDRRFRYPFINCTNCGPRFTIIEDTPYDRGKTTMKDFPMCPSCLKEFEDPHSRRFHAQPNACFDCGPMVRLLDHDGRGIDSSDPPREACRLLKAGKIVAIKGLGGFHLACDAGNDRSVAALRARKYREDKPFALMAPDIETIRGHCAVDASEEKLLLSEKRPIVLLEKLLPGSLAPDVAPGQNTYGFMLPYTPLHHILLRESGLILVMTSGNVSDEPICHDNDEALRRLSGIADYFLLHDRRIHIRCDDSVTRSFRGGEMLLRRSRGYVPVPIDITWDFRAPLMACGGELKSTFCLARGRDVFISHHIGDLENHETLLSFEQGIDHFKGLLAFEPEIVAYDLHPEYLSTKFALGLSNIRSEPVQHHHAHMAACMADNNCDETVIGVIFDGLGYGPDGTFWGGEFLRGDFRGFERKASFKALPLPGGARAIKEPWRMALCYLYDAFGEELINIPLPLVQSIEKKKWPVLMKMLRGGPGSPPTSSAGRAFDAVSALLGLRTSINYEGQAAIDLQMAAGALTDDSYEFNIASQGELAIVDLASTVRAILEDIKGRVAVPVMARKFHNTLAIVVEGLCRNIRDDHGTTKVALSGGVFQNMLFLDLCHQRLEKAGFQVLIHRRVPPNDGGICLGQALIANARC